MVLLLVFGMISLPSSTIVPILLLISYHFVRTERNKFFFMTNSSSNTFNLDNISWIYSKLFNPILGTKRRLGVHAWLPLSYWNIESHLGGHIVPGDNMFQALWKFFLDYDDIMQVQSYWESIQAQPKFALSIVRARQVIWLVPLQAIRSFLHLAIVA